MDPREGLDPLLPQPAKRILEHQRRIHELATQLEKEGTDDLDEYIRELDRRSNEGGPIWA